LEVVDYANVLKLVGDMKKYFYYGKMLECDDCTVSKATTMWMQLITTEADVVLKRMFRTRLLHFVRPVHLVASLLDPTSPYRELDMNDIVKTLLPCVCSISKAMNPARPAEKIKEGLQGWLIGHARLRTAGQYEEPQRAKKFWGDINVASSCAVMYDVHEAFKSTIASEAGCERIFSQQKMHHRPQRNGMKADLLEAELCIKMRLRRPQLRTEFEDDVEEVEEAEAEPLPEPPAEDYPQPPQYVTFVQLQELLRLYKRAEQWESIRKDVYITMTLPGGNPCRVQVTEVDKRKADLSFCVGTNKRKIFLADIETEWTV